MLYLSSKRLYICVDGLDGLVEDQLELFLKLIMKMLSLGARIMIFNRRFPRIEECFQDDAALVSVEDLRDWNSQSVALQSASSGTPARLRPNSGCCRGLADRAGPCSPSPTEFPYL